MLDRGWNVRTSPLKVLLRLLTPFLQLQHKGKGKGNENVKANEMRRMTVVKGNMKCISSEDEERRSREEDEAEVRDALVDRKASLVAAECLRKVISLTSHHSSQILRLGGPSSSSSSSSSSSTLSSSVCNEASVAMGVGVGAGRADHPSAVGGILITLLQSRPLPPPTAPPADLRAVNSSPALSTLRDCMAYERALKGAQCTVALFDGLRDLLSLSTSTPPIVTSTATAFTVDSRLPQYLSANINSTDACQAVAEHGLFAQRAGSPEGGIIRTPALEVLQCLSRLPQCFLLLDAAHSFSLRRQQTGVRVVIREGFNRKGKEEEEEEERVIGDGIDRGIDEQRLNAEVMITLQALVSAWQLGVNAIGRHFTGMEVEVEVEGAGAGVMDMQQDSHSQRSSSAFSQSASQRFGAGKIQYGVSQQVGRVQVEVNTLSILSQFNNSVICLKQFSGLCTETEK